jgi:hypothetical protein
VKIRKGGKELKQLGAAEKRRNKMTFATEQAQLAAEEKTAKEHEKEVARLKEEKGRKGGQNVIGFGVKAIRGSQR